MLKWLLKKVRNLLIWPIRLQDLLWEIHLNINTRKRLSKRYIRSFFNDAGSYDGSHYYALLKIMKRIPNKENNQIADYGCGKGRVVCFAARFPFKKVIGIEVNSELVSIAKRNSEKVRNKIAPIEIVQDDAVNFDCAAVTIFFFYNPFGSKTMEMVLDRIRQDLMDNPRSIQIVYYNPQHFEVLDKCGWLRRNSSLCFKTITIQEASTGLVEFYENK